MIISIKYFSFLIITLIIINVIKKDILRKYIFVISSLLLIGLFDVVSLLFVLLLSYFNYIIALMILKSDKKKAFLITGILINLLPLIFFKYHFINIFGIGNIFNSYNSIKLTDLFIPLGISYFTLKFISYLADVYRGTSKGGSFIDILLYGSFFPTYFAGPIEKYGRFNSELSNLRKIEVVDIENGIMRLSAGLFKKLVISNWIGYFFAENYKNIHSLSLEALILTLFAFSIQVYMDFSGYSDIAIGSSQLFGIRIMENFDYPYLKPNISQFWRGWHISLSNWIRDYIFLPLAYRNYGKLWLYLVVPIVSMIICGIWHGSEAKYILWGAYHGIGISLYQIWNRFLKRKYSLIKFTPKLSYAFSVAITFIFVMFSWYFFV